MPGSSRSPPRLGHGPRSMRTARSWRVPLPLVPGWRRATPAKPHTPPGSPRAVRQKRFEAAIALQGRGAGIALVSRGIEGTIVLDEAGTVWRVGPSPERGAFPVGSGDSALAGFLAAIAAGATTEESARHAVAAGTANALRPGQGEIDPPKWHGSCPGRRSRRSASHILVAGDDDDVPASCVRPTAHRPPSVRGPLT